MQTIQNSKKWFKTSFVAGTVFFLLAIGSLLTLYAPKAFALCDKVNIVYCGLSGSNAQGYIDSLRNYYSTSRDSYGNTDIRGILQWGGWNDGNINALDTNNTRLGTLYRDGRIIVDGREVANTTWVTARFSGGAGFQHISGNVYSRLTTTSFKYETKQVLIHFGADGNADAGIITDCGNTIKFTVVPVPKPVVTDCTGLTATVVDLSKFSYTFTAAARAENATLTGGSFDFGDGTKANGTVSGTNVLVNHQYAQSGDYTITATVTFSAGGANTSKTCQTEVSTPYYECVKLDGPVPDYLNYTFVATARYGNGATLVGGDFDFGDGKTATGVKLTDTNEVKTTHTYEKAGNYSAVATLHFTVGGKDVTAAGCRTSVKPNQKPIPECKPGVPVGDIRCNPCEYDASIPKDDPRCVAPVATLPNTGAGNVIALASAALVGGFLWYRHILFRRHKRAYLAADFGTSPLPLAEPLETPDPLAATPLAPQKHSRLSLRRRRQF